MRANMKNLKSGLIATALLLIAAAASAQATKEQVPGVTNFARLETTIACAGATTPSAIADVKKMGYKAVINLRQPSEAGADVEAEEAAAKAAGITYIHLPFNTAAPDSSIVERFLDAVTALANQPAFVHCASGNRAAALWMVKRLAVDHWDADRASTEAASLGLTNQALKTFAIDYAAAHRR